jgi:hypothetical protein
VFNYEPMIYLCMRFNKMWMDGTMEPLPGNFTSRSYSSPIQGRIVHGFRSSAPRLR